MYIYIYRERERLRFIERERYYFQHRVEQRIASRTTCVTVRSHLSCLHLRRGQANLSFVRVIRAQGPS